MFRSRDKEKITVAAAGPAERDMNVKAQHEPQQKKRSKEQRSGIAKDMLRNRLIEIICYEFGNEISSQAELLLIVAGPDKDRPQPRTEPAFDIDGFVPDEKRLASVYIKPFLEKISHRLFDHSGSRFAAIHETVVFGMGMLRMGWTEITAIKSGTRCRKQLIEITVHILDLLHRGDAPRYSCLVRHDDDPVAGIPGHRHSLSGTIDKHQLFPGRDVYALVLIDGTIPVEKKNFNFPHVPFLFFEQIAVEGIVLLCRVFPREITAHRSIDDLLPPSLIKEELKGFTELADE